MSKLRISSLIVAILTIAVYLPSIHNGFVNFDDPIYVYNNPHISSLGPSFVKWAFTTFYAANYHPLTWLSHSIDYTFWGMNPLGHHLSSVLLHGLNSLLVTLLVFHLAGHTKKENGYIDDNFALATALVTGLLFGLHPIHVESVAWISERKDLLCAFFFLLSLLFYLKYYASSLKLRYYLLCLLSFTLALLSKPMAVTLPAVLILLDIYPLERLSLKKAFSLHRQVLIEKVPFIGLSAAAAILTILAQQRAMAPMELISADARLKMALHSLGFYLTKMILPLNLVPFYPHPKRLSLFAPNMILMFLLVMAVVVSCFYFLKRKHKFWPATWSYYLITLMPVLGIIQVGEQAAADRYTYLPSLGPFLLLGSGLAYLLIKKKTDRFSNVFQAKILLPFIIGITVLSIMTLKQAGIWRDSITLWDAELKVFPNNEKAYFTQGSYYNEIGEFKKAVERFDIALKIRPQFARAYFNRALAHEDLGNYNQAIADYNLAISSKQDYSLAYVNRGILYAKMGSYDNAIHDFSKGIDLDPDDGFAYYNRGLVYELIGKPQEAYKDFQTSAELRNQAAQNRFTLKKQSVK